MIDDKTMKSLQGLSRLRLTPEEEQSLAGQLEDIIQYFELLSGYDTTGVDPDIGIEVAPAELRADAREKGVERSVIETFATEFSDGFFVVPKILGDGQDA